MLREIEKEKLTDGMYVRFTMSVLSDGNYIPDLIQLLEKEESVKYIEPLEDGLLMFVVLAHEGDTIRPYYETVTVREHIHSLLENKNYHLAFVTTNKGSDTHRLVGSVLYLNEKRKTSESAISDDTMIEVANCGDSTIEAVMSYYREYVCALNS